MRILTAYLRKSERTSTANSTCCCIRWRLPREALEGRFVDTTREAFSTAHDISAYSLVALAKRAAPLMTDGGSIIGMSYYGAEKVIKHYNVMGVAKAALRRAHAILLPISVSKDSRQLHQRRPGEHACRTGNRRFSDMLKHYDEHAPLRRNVTHEELGQTGSSLPAPARPSPARSSTSTAATKLWAACDRYAVSAVFLTHSLASRKVGWVYSKPSASLNRLFDTRLFVMPLFVWTGRVQGRMVVVGDLFFT